MLRKGHGGLYKAATKEERRRRKATRKREIRSSLLVLDLKDGKLQDSGKQEGNTLHKLHVLGMNERNRNNIPGLLRAMLEEGTRKELPLNRKGENSS